MQSLQSKRRFKFDNHLLRILAKLLRLPPILMELRNALGLANEVIVVYLNGGGGVGRILGSECHHIIPQPCEASTVLLALHHFLLEIVLMVFPHR